MKSSSFVKVVIFLILSTSLTCLLAFLLGTLYIPQSFISTSATELTPKYTTVVIDAGHGGEDGGASSAAGLVEKNVNLDIANMLCDMLKANGINVIMTRNEDKLLYDRNVNYQGRKKKLDLAARLAIADSAPDAIFVSIHMNSFTDPKYSGMQVWYSPNHKSSQSLAEIIQQRNQKMLQPDNTRKIKCASSNINLLYNANCPAVLVECGFLSNPDEAALFETKEYKQKVAFLLFCSIMDFLNEPASAS